MKHRGMDSRKLLKLLRQMDRSYQPTAVEFALLRCQTELILNEASITALPESIGRLSALQRLDLSGTSINALPESIGRLSALQWLDLSGTSINALPESIGRLSALQWLDLSRTRITALPESFGQLSALQELYLYNTPITALPESLWQLSSLKTLDLSRTWITTLPESLWQLSALQKLNISDTRITALPESFEQLSALQTLDLSHTRITALPESFGQLSALQTLDLSHTLITALPESFWQLSALVNLKLFYTPITVLPESFWQLSALQTLDLSGRPITALPESIGQLSALQTLDLSYTQITALPESFGQLSALQKLDLSYTPITALPDSFGQLSALQKLYLISTQITALPESFGQLSALQTLFLSHTQITALPESFGQLSALQRLDLSDTRITKLPEWIGDLPALQRLDLDGLTLPALPRSLALRGLPFRNRSRSSRDETGVFLSGTTLTRQKISIFLETPELIPSLYEETEQAAIRESKVIFLGDGAAGKSYTIRRFQAEGRPEGEGSSFECSETPGVEIADYPVKGRNSFTIHFWDFGGQQLLHSMHRCFLTEDTCYVVTVKTREAKANERARYWLQNVSAFAPKSPILLYVNCWDNDNGLRAIDEPGLRAEFPNIQQVVYCSAKNAPEPEFREKLMEPLIALAAASKGCTKQVPRSWIRVKKAIEAESEKHNYLTREQYHALCAREGIKDENASELLSFFNNLGVCFSYHRDRDRKELTDYRLLNPVWLTNAVYAVIEEGMAFAPEGRIRRSAIAQMLCNKAPEQVRGRQYRRTVPELVYSPEECPYILDVALAHELCYPVDEDSLFFPALCTNNTPVEALAQQTDYPVLAAYRFDYDYLPDSVIHRLMVRCLQKGYQITGCWLRGMVLGKLTNQRAIISMRDDKQLRVELYSKPGHPAYELFPTLRREILEISRSHNLRCREFITDGKDSFPLGKLLLSHRAGMETDLGDVSYRLFRILELLERFFDAWTISAMEVGEEGVFVQPYRYHPAKKSDPVLRKAIWEAYGKKCQYCGDLLRPNQLQIDHILAANHLGVPDSHVALYLAELKENNGFDLEKPDFIENYFPACGDCNRKKSNETRSAVTLREYHAIALNHTPKTLTLYQTYREELKDDQALSAFEETEAEV